MHAYGPSLTQTLTVSPDWVETQSHADWLTAPEMHRLSAFQSPARRRDWLAGRLAMKRLLLGTWQIAPSECPIGTDGVAPHVPASRLAHINCTLSHSAGWGAASWANTQTEGTAGVDIQQMRPVHPRLAARILGESERRQHETWRERLGHDEAILLVWALKEAAVKARRLPWGRALSSITVRLVDQHTAAITLPDEPCTFHAEYQRHGSMWVARAVRPPTKRDSL